ncbi:SGNH/GDSL hydrolase family protein [Paenibacillus eucommiae]|uniref:Lysophospholipase L1-like esterase n=1 Tax=Paenibacillus eucommiae TaxID=1355755 RepID=A0ABS4J593_9BACL|nr:SGNH/GDSL hydrolase family protein [Paenibacillus eucommiae]MBP1993959.1 lysophospholipase L1-like esterase [Paenibacillus eucommiae]
MLQIIEKLRNGQRSLIVCMGDSITEQNFHLHSHINYVGHFSEKLINTFGRNQFIINTGVSGDTTWGAVARLERDALRFKPDLVTLMFGMNDSARGMDELPVFKQNLESLIASIRESGSEVLLLTQNILKFEIKDNASRASYPYYAEAIREVAATTGAPLCDIYQKWEATAKEINYKHWMMMDDEIHPNEHGHQFMANILFEFLGLD